MVYIVYRGVAGVALLFSRSEFDKISEDSFTLTLMHKTPIVDVILILDLNIMKERAISRELFLCMYNLVLDAIYIFEIKLS
jgi:hypothetical protein